MAIKITPGLVRYQFSCLSGANGSFLRARTIVILFSEDGGSSASFRSFCVEWRLVFEILAVSNRVGGAR